MTDPQSKPLAEARELAAQYARHPADHYGSASVATRDCITLAKALLSTDALRDALTKTRAALIRLRRCLDGDELRSLTEEAAALFAANAALHTGGEGKGETVDTKPERVVRHGGPSGPRGGVRIEPPVTRSGTSPTPVPATGETESAKLNEYDKDEWWDVCRKARPDLTLEEFEAMWGEFVRLKAAPHTSAPAPAIGQIDRLRAIHSALAEALGDRDITHIEDDTELREQEPVQWAASKLAEIVFAGTQPPVPPAATEDDKERQDLSDGLAKHIAKMELTLPVDRDEINILRLVKATFDTDSERLAVARSRAPAAGVEGWQTVEWTGYINGLIWAGNRVGKIVGNDAHTVIALRAQLDAEQGRAEAKLAAVRPKDAGA